MYRSADSIKAISKIDNHFKIYSWLVPMITWNSNFVASLHWNCLSSTYYKFPPSMAENI